MAVESHNGYYLYHYNPSIAGAVIFAILFAILSILHFYRLFRTRTWFMLAFAIGGLCKNLLPHQFFSPINPD